MKNKEPRFTADEFKLYIMNSDSYGDAMYNCNSLNIISSIVKQTVLEIISEIVQIELFEIHLNTYFMDEFNTSEIAGIKTKVLLSIPWAYKTNIDDLLEETIQTLIDELIEKADKKWKIH